jgi:hypothetical protein
MMRKLSSSDETLSYIRGEVFREGRGGNNPLPAAGVFPGQAAMVKSSMRLS